MTTKLYETHGLNYGDIVTVEGYDGQYFRINGYQKNVLETEGEPDLIEHWLDITCAHTGGYTMAYADEVTLACRKDEASEFLADKPTPNIGTGGGIAIASIFDMFRVDEAPLNPLTPPSKATLQSRTQPQIDALLDQLSDWTSLKVTLGDEKGEYQRKIDAIKAQLGVVSA